MRRLIPDYPLSATATRPEWSQLPTGIRRVVIDRCGAEVDAALSVTVGFTAGFASRLRFTDGSTAFVKAADRVGDAWHDHAVDGYLEEARKLRALPPAVPAPRLRWLYEGGVDGRDWVVLCFDDVDGRPPMRPWQGAELAGVLDCLERAADALTPAPSGLPTSDFATEFAPEVERWTTLAAYPPTAPHAAEARQLCDAGLAGARGDSLIHADLRDDNVIIGNDGQVWICDWNWPMRGAAWIDTLTLLLSAHGDGIDTDALLASRRLTADLNAASIDGMLAILAGYFLTQQHEPVPASSPWVRLHQRWYGEVAWNWLSTRRGWQ
jgi:Ser/Thr protein kinase RdoA (MazF antagonist)